MLPKYHIALGIIFSFILIYFFNLSLIAGAIVFLSSVLIDVDHYIYYLYKKKDLSLKRAYRWFIKKREKLLELPKEQRNKNYISFSFLHGFEILILLFILGKLFSAYFFYVLIGFGFHLFLDIIYGIIIFGRFERVFLLYDFLRYKTQIKNYSY
jgi:hypothetical protein